MEHLTGDIKKGEKPEGRSSAACSVWRSPRGRRGFTLVELLVVISIISLLSSIVFSGVTNQRAKARDARRFAELFQIRRALDLYADAHNETYPALPSSTCGTWNRSDAIPNTEIADTCWSELGNVLSQWLLQFPTDPINSVTDNIPRVYAYQQRNGGAGYRLVAALETSSGLGDGCAILLEPGPTGPDPAAFPASFYCIGEKWQ